MIFFLRDTGTLDSGGFGNGAALTNGILFRFAYDVGEASEGFYPDPTFFPIKINSQWQAYCHDITVSDWGSGDQAYSTRYTFGNDSPGAPPWISAIRKEEFQMVIQDDLSAISEIYCRLGCTRVPE